MSCIGCVRVCVCVPGFQLATLEQRAKFQVSQVSAVQSMGGKKESEQCSYVGFSRHQFSGNQVESNAIERKETSEYAE